MSTAACRSNHSSQSFTRQHHRTSSTHALLPSMSNDRPRDPFQPKNKRHSTSLIRESLLSTSTKASPSITSSTAHSSQSLLSTRSNLSQVTETSTSNIAKQPYMFSNPPRELQRQSIQTMKCLRHHRLRQRVSSAPDENSCQNSPRSLLNQQKPLSANDCLTPCSHDDEHPVSSMQPFKRNEQETNSLNDLLKQQERSNVPKAVQKRRIILLFRRLPGSTPPLISPRQQHNVSPLRPEMPFIDINQIQNDKSTCNSPQYHQTFDSPTYDPFSCIDQAEMADSKQLAAILANIQPMDDWIPYTTHDGTSPRHVQQTFDPKKYEYVANNSLDMTTFKLSPRTLKPDEELAARSRFSQNYRYEMLSSANAQLPPLMASIVTENNNNNVGSTTGIEKAFTFRLNPTVPMKKPKSVEEIESTPSMLESEQVQLCFDEILKCFYDPNTGIYYELTSA